ncbi:hypothetical protein D3C84_996360 [compost metagenome]
MRLPVKVQGAQVVVAGALRHLPAIQPELRVFAKGVEAVGVRRAGKQLGVLGIVQQPHLDQADYLSTQSGCSLDAFLRDGIRERFAAALSVPGEADAEGFAEDFHPGGHIHWLSSHSSYLRLL